jgi:hypothetical protein
MGLRYRKTVKLLPGLKLNITQNGLASVSIGSRKININISRHGIRANLGFLKTRLADNNRKKFN